jgi:hypothetical protein
VCLRYQIGAEATFFEGTGIKTNRLADDPKLWADTTTFHVVLETAATHHLVHVEGHPLGVHSQPCPIALLEGLCEVLLRVCYI